MKNRLDTHFMLSVFEHIRTHGQPVDQGHELEGMRASSDFDGYTAYLSYNQVTLTIGFHNQYQFDYANRQALHEFLRKAEQIAERYARSPSSEVSSHAG